MLTKKSTLIILLLFSNFILAQEYKMIPLEDPKFESENKKFEIREYGGIKKMGVPGIFIQSDKGMHVYSSGIVQFESRNGHNSLKIELSEHIESSQIKVILRTAAVQITEAGNYIFGFYAKSNHTKNEASIGGNLTKTAAFKKPISLPKTSYKQISIDKEWSFIMQEFTVTEDDLDKGYGYLSFGIDISKYNSRKILLDDLMLAKVTIDNYQSSFKTDFSQRQAILNIFPMKTQAVILKDQLVVRALDPNDYTGNFNNFGFGQKIKLNTPLQNRVGTKYKVRFKLKVKDTNKLYPSVVNKKAGQGNFIKKKQETTKFACQVQMIGDSGHIYKKTTKQKVLVSNEFSEFEAIFTIDQDEKINQLMISMGSNLNAYVGNLIIEEIAVDPIN